MVPPCVTSLAARTITALRAAHEELAAVVPDLSEEQLGRASGASEWTVAQVLSHLGSGAEIGLLGYAAALAGYEPPPADLNQTVWDRWNAATPREQADEFLRHNEALVSWLEALSAHDRETLQVKLGYLPAPLPLASIAGMRLQELLLHSWDARVGLDPAARIDGGAALLAFEHLTGELGFLLRFTGKADQLAEPARVAVDGTGVVVLVEEHVSVPASGSAGPTATFQGTPEAALRLLAGRLKAPYLPDGVEVTGNVTLDDLRRVFPGY